MKKCEPFSIFKFRVKSICIRHDPLNRTGVIHLISTRRNPVGRLMFRHQPLLLISVQSSGKMKGHLHRKNYANWPTQCMRIFFKISHACSNSQKRNSLFRWKEILSIVRSVCRINRLFFCQKFGRVTPFLRRSNTFSPLNVSLTKPC